MSKWTATDLFTVYDTLIALWQLHKVISSYGLSKVVIQHHPQTGHSFVYKIM